MGASQCNGARQDGGAGRDRVGQDTDKSVPSPGKEHWNNFFCHRKKSYASHVWEQGINGFTEKMAQRPVYNYHSHTHEINFVSLAEITAHSSVMLICRPNYAA